MKYFFSILLITLFCSCTLTRKSQKNHSSKSSIESELQGQWSLLNSKVVYDIPFINEEDSLQVNVLSQESELEDDGWADVFAEVSLDDYFIKNDSLFEVNTAFELTGKGTYSVDGNYIYLSGDLFPFSCRNDTLEIYHVAENNTYLKATYTKSEVHEEFFYTPLIETDDSINFKLQGEWHIIHSEYGYETSDKYLQRYATPNLVFEEDSAIFIIPPLELVRIKPYRILRDHIHFEDHSQPFNYYNDTLELYFMGEKDYQKVTYLKSEVNHDLLSMLKKHTINYPLLTGEWALVREYEDQHCRYQLDFPYEIADTITVSKEDTWSVMNHKNYLMITNDTLRNYELGYEWGSLTLKPGNWYQGLDPGIHYNKLPPKPQNIPKFHGHWKILNREKVTDISFIKNNWLMEPNTVSNNIFEDGIFMPDYIFEDDSVFEIDAPMELINKGTYYTEGNYLTMHGITFPYSYSNDTIDLFLFYKIGEYLKLTYAISEIDHELLSILKRHRVNYPLLSGKWVLDKNDHSWEFPYEIADTIMISKEEIISTIEEDQSFFMITDGERKKYKLGYHHLDINFCEIYDENWRSMNPNIKMETKKCYNDYDRTVNSPYLTLRAMGWGNEHMSTLFYKRLKE